LFSRDSLSMIKIFIIDDDLHIRTACVRVLSKAGYEVSCAETGNEGLIAIQNAPESIDVLLLDQLLPGMSGMDVLAQIQTICPSLPVIVMTGSLTEESAAELKEKGACNCLAKPFTPEQLRNAITQAAGNKPPQ
jgi:DNA-binding NtrC family response regulator